MSSSVTAMKCMSLVKQILLKYVLRVGMISENKTHTQSGELLQNKYRGSMYSFPDVFWTSNNFKHTSLSCLPVCYFSSLSVWV